MERKKEGLEHGEVVERVCRLRGEQIPNYDPDTDCHYGVISTNELNLDAVNDITMYGDNLDFEAWKAGISAELAEHLPKVLAQLVTLSDDPNEVIARMFLRRWEKGDLPLCKIPAQIIPLIARVNLGIGAWTCFLATCTDVGGRGTEDYGDELSELVEELLNPKRLQELLLPVGIDRAEHQGPQDVAYSLLGDVQFTLKKHAAHCQEQILDQLVQDTPVEGGTWRWEDGDTIVLLDEQNDVMVVKSPYYTTCHECSPCAPNAGHLMDQRKDPTRRSMKTYCLPADWFEDEKCPYPYWSVSDGDLEYHPTGVLVCRFCSKNTPAKTARFHQELAVCQACWDERLRTTK